MEGLEFSEEEENVVSFALYDLASGCLSELKAGVLGIVAPYVHGYIWQRDCFHLFTSEELTPPWISDCQKGPEFLWGHVQFGDAVDEEWFVVSLLLKITEMRQSMVAQAWDNDGEFLLIEAAYALPKWIKPETSQNRVWLRNGKLHIIPRRFSSGQDTEEITLEDAIAILMSNSKTEAREEIQKKIMDRIRPFPEDMSSTQHLARFRCYVPAKVACLLSRCPFVISQAVEMFLDRQAADMTALSHPVYVPPVDFVMSMVKFHRCSYAQLMQTEFHPPKNYTLPDTSDPIFKSVELGMKVTCGMELLCRHLSQQKDNVRVRDPFEGEAWSKFVSILELSRLKDKDQLHQGAAYMFLCSQVSKDKDTKTARLAHLIKLNSESCVSAEAFAANHQLFAEDDDSWLYEGHADLEKELNKRESEQTSHKTQQPPCDPTDLIQTFGSFVDAISSHEGAELPQGVGFNARRFMDELQSALGEGFAEQFSQLRIESSHSSSEDSDLLTSPTSSQEDSLSSDSDKVLTASDSDDDSEFAEAYSEAMQSELDQTKMQESFIKAPGQSEGTSLSEIDLDVNLVENLMHSYSQQAGCPGPVSNLVGSALSIEHRNSHTRKQ